MIRLIVRPRAIGPRRQRERRVPLEGGIVARRDRSTSVQDRVEPVELRQPDRRVHVAHPVVVAGLVVAQAGAGRVRGDPGVVSQSTNSVGHLGRAGGDQAAFAGRDHFSGVKREAAQRPALGFADRRAGPGAAQRAGGVFDDGELPLGGQAAHGVEIRRQPELVHGQDRPTGRGDALPRVVDVDVEGVRIDVDQDDIGAGHSDRVGAGDKRERGYQHRVARTDARGDQREM